MQLIAVTRKLLEGSRCFEFVSVGRLCVTGSVLVLVWVCMGCIIWPRLFSWGNLLHRGPVETEVLSPSFSRLWEGAVLNEGDKGQEIVPMASASGGKEQEGYQGWCVRVRFPTRPHMCLRHTPIKQCNCVSLSVSSCIHHIALVESWAVTTVFY